MAVELVKSAGITAQDNNLSVNSYIEQGGVRSAVGTGAVTATASIASIIRLVRIQSNARLASLSLFCTAITSAAGDVGLYRTADDGGAVVDADAFIAAQTLAAASPGINVIGGNLLSPANREKRLWEALGLTADPITYYDIAVTLTAAATAIGTMGIEVEWTI
jgi:hypothetical protein